MIGSYVLSKAGRDKSKYFIILSVIDENYVMICDGKLRSLKNPKKKKIKHLKILNEVDLEIKNRLIEKKQLSDLLVRESIELFISSKEV
ncbi:MAG: RNA-binding protein [Oscillospiraceae bacterium]|nr:RNA-binding protein [Oscillospiraceae bacterium]